MAIRPDEFEIYEQLILTGQMPEDRIIGLIKENTEFAAWYKIRSIERRADRSSCSIADAA